MANSLFPIGWQILYVTIDLRFQDVNIWKMVIASDKWSLVAFMEDEIRHRM